MTSAIRLLLLDLDGVVRHFDKSVADQLEIDHNIEVGSLRREAFEHPRGRDAITGLLTRAQWADQVGHAVGSAEAATSWLMTWGYANPAMITFVSETRATGLPVAILTNGTSTIDEELASVGLTDVFDHVFCTWSIGYPKPEPEAYLYVCDALAIEPQHVLFVDDRQTNVDGAAAVGMQAELFEGVDSLRQTMSALRY